VVAAEPPSLDPAPVPAPPEDLGDVEAWLDYKRRAHLSGLPDESRLFYRRGLIAARSGQEQEAIRLVRGAAELDPSFVTPNLTLASWFLVRDPSQALLRCAAVLSVLGRSFLLQIELAANLLFFALNGFFVGLLATALLIVFLRNAELRHMWEERLRRRLSPGTTRIFAWTLLIVPFVAGFGLALPAIVLLGLLWPVLRARERVIHVMLWIALLAAPFAGHLMGRLATPLREDRAPLFGVAALQDAAWSPSRQARLQRLAARQPDSPFVLFGLGWMAQKGRDLVTAEAAYRRALALWPENPRVLNNLANVYVAQGRLNPAIELYRRAIASDPTDAAAHYNLSQVYTRQFEYRAASEEAARASALDFEFVKTQQSLGTQDGAQPLADEWIAPATFWRSMLAVDRAAQPEPVLPFAWRGCIETSGPPFAAAALLLGLAALFLGLRWQRSLPLRQCRNCGRVVCRRCAERRRELALCPSCAAQQLRADSPDFARALLSRERLRLERSLRLVRTSLAALLPGFGLLAFRRVFRATLLIIATAMLVGPWLGVRAPFAYQPGPGLDDGVASPIPVLAALALVYMVSLLGYVSQANRAAALAAADAAPVRSRPSQATRAAAKAA
jgi:tetratricopeptide (TPR) repeat protein